MSKKSLLILIVIALLVFILGLFYYLFLTTQVSVTPTDVNPSDAFPLGQPGTQNNNSGQTSGQGTNADNNNGLGENQGEQTVVLPTLRLLSHNPVAGAITLNPSTTTAVVRYLERATGHTYEISLLDTTSRRLTNTTIPKVYEAIWSSRGDNVVLRYLNENTDAIQSYIGKIKLSTTSTENTSLTGTFLPQDLTQVAINPVGDSLFGLYNTTDGGAAGFISAFDSSKKQAVFSSGAGEWLVAWPRPDTLTLTTKASFGVPGYIFSLNTKTGDFNKLFGGINGLTTLANFDLTKILYSEISDQLFKNFVYDLKNKTVTALTIKTLPEKCVWSKNSRDLLYCAIPEDIGSNKLPDDWYQGKVNFRDMIWQIDTKTNEATQVSPLYQFEVPDNIDVINPMLDKTESYLVFTSKNDLSLWALKLK